MKKVNKILSSVRSMMKTRKCAAVFSASVFALSSITCVAQVSAVKEAEKALSGDSVGQKAVLELSESYLSLNADNNISVLEISSEFFKGSDAEFVSNGSVEENAANSESEVTTKSEETTAKAETTTKAAAQETQTKVPDTSASATTQPVTQQVNLVAGGTYTFSQLGITQMSDIPVPDDILFDENGIPLNYSYKLTGKATAYNMGTTTATGTSVHPGVVAVNPNIIPYGSKMYIVASDGSGYVYGYASAEDTGGFIYWDNAPIVDMYVNSYSDACYWGNRPVTVYVF